ncbi:Fatty acid hydroxylase domain-containing protein 2 [Araneus ventricosus]|uniref:Fatty acid hydroxylase domain-containing protein 2 n=1 Tax=Araneus ventricosus TaxID=182803 RepID=A0A4Y2W307_ARAVE|nr:Fatty acid hydroxylase domain-containing protein 2 [Araneus ventricosus]
MDNNKSQENDSYSENEDMIQPKPHRNEMLQSFEAIKRGFEMEENVPDSIFSSLIKCENFYENLTSRNAKLLHHPRIYKYIHKMHHEWTSPIAITAIYCHPVEHLLSNLMPALLGPLILGSHMFTSWIWFSLALLSTLNSHCGFHFPFFPSPEAHDFHHLK